MESDSRDYRVREIDNVARCGASNCSGKVRRPVQLEHAEAVEQHGLRIRPAKFQRSAAADHRRSGSGDRSYYIDGATVRFQHPRIHQAVVDRERATEGGFEQAGVANGVAGVDDNSVTRAANVGVDGSGRVVHKRQLAVAPPNYAAAENRVIHVFELRARAGDPDDQVITGRAEQFDHAATGQRHRAVDA